MVKNKRAGIRAIRPTVTLLMAGLIVIGLATISGSTASVVQAAKVSAASIPPAIAPVFNYPRLAIYGGISNANGQPYVTYVGNGYGGILNQQAVDLTMRNQLVIFPAEPMMMNYLADPASSMAHAFRVKNPGSEILAYWWFDFPWASADMNPAPHLVGDVVRKVTEPGKEDWYIHQLPNHDRWAASWGSYNLNFADSAFVDWYVDYVSNRVIKAGRDAGIWDGIFFDNMCDDISWETNAANIDFNFGEAYGQPHYNTITDYYAARVAGITRFLSEVRQQVGSDVILAGNCAWGWHADVVNGLMIEDFPFLKSIGGLSGTFTQWDFNMMGPAGGIMVHDVTVQPPSVNTVRQIGRLGGATTATNIQLGRQGIVSGLMSDNYYLLDDPNREYGENFWRGYNYWYDEYDNAGQGVGYLGQPLNNAYQIIDQSKLTGPDLWGSGDVEVGTLNDLAGWTFLAASGNSWSLDNTTAATGNKSIHATITAATGGFDTRMYKPVATSNSSATPFSMTFWAKADRRIPIQVQMDAYAISNNAYTPVANAAIIADTTWRQYQVSGIVPNPSNMSLTYYVGRYVGNVWIDGITFQQGTGHVWRRDFEHGSAFFNPCNDFSYCPTSTATMNIQLTDPQGNLTDESGNRVTMKHIDGVLNRTINDGTTVTSVSVPPADGVVLLSTSNPPLNPLPCTPAWTYSSWSACVAGSQSRTATDSNSCRSTANRAPVTQSCGGILNVNQPPPTSDTTPPAAVQDLRAR